MQDTFIRPTTFQLRIFFPCVDPAQERTCFLIGSGRARITIMVQQRHGRVTKLPILTFLPGSCLSGKHFIGNRVPFA
jgi:hypothetical protein